MLVIFIGAGFFLFFEKRTGFNRFILFRFSKYSVNNRNKTVD